ncbi:hypothetical protein [Leifsonia sp. NPDC080035]|uniref:Glycosyltransferase n=1 Tax=Leifsonia sp. NPDC080035 TaxID=3143936 RepID=A0AAU7GEG4_9MICO
MPASRPPRVTHFNDCAFVGQALVRAAGRAGLEWGYVPPERVRPAAGFRGGKHLLAELPYVARHERVALTSDVLHIHYATSVPLMRKPYIPRRPYALHLHGTDIRTQWAAPETHALIQSAIDGAIAVYYTNVDTEEQATTARSDARYMAGFVQLELLPEWAPSNGGARTLAFASRWDDSKNVQRQLEFVRALKPALPAGVRMVGLDWGPEARDAAALGVELVPRGTHEEYLRWLATADVVVGQAAGILAVSEREAMAIGPAVVVPATLIGDSGELPVLSGSIAEAVQQTVHVLADPRAASSALNARAYIAEHFTADRWIPELDALYRSAAR